MKKLLFYIAVIAAVATLGGCTTNNGDIGPLFGTWRFESVAVGGVDVNLEADSVESYSLVFQNRIVRVIEVRERHDHEYYTGTFRHRENLLELDFSHSDKLNGTTIYTPPSVLGFEPHGVTNLIVTKLTKRQMEAYRVDNNGVTHTYKFSKSY